MLLRRIASLIKKTVLNLLRLFPINNKKIIISSYYGKGYGDNLKYIVDELLKANCYKIIWIVKNSEIKKSLPKGVKACKFGSFAATFHYITAKIWIDNCRKGFHFKRKNQFYIQTWHGFALKKIEKDATQSLCDDYESFATRDSEQIDLIISCSDFMTKIYKNSFWYSGEVAEFGSPRNDVIINQNPSVIYKVREYFGLSESKKIVLYAPTFRKDLSLEPYSLDYDALIDCCNKRYGGEFVVLIRLHPNISELARDINYDENKINATNYPDMQELLVASDIVISDYSSLMFDFALSQKPCFQFATDINAYKGDRNFYFDLSRLPFSVSTDNTMLHQNILSFDEVQYKKQVDEFFDSVGMIRDGKASVRIAELIKEKTSKK